MSNDEENISSKEHYQWIDSWRGLLIILVVLGHAVGAASHFTDGFFSELQTHIFKFIYMFHMASFFALAGLTFSTKEENWETFIWRKFKRLIVPYFAFGIGSYLLFICFYGGFSSAVATATDDYYADKTSIVWWQPLLGLLHAGGWPNGQGFQMNSVLWFLPCMFSAEIVFKGLLKIIKNRISALIIAVALLVGQCLLSLYCPICLPWGLNKVMYYLAFMLLGRFAMTKKTFCLVEKSRGFAWGCLVLMIAAYYFVSMLPPNDYWYSTSWRYVLPLFVVAGIYLSAFIAQLISGKTLAFIGTCSMGIMLVHKFPLVALQMKMPLFKALAKTSVVYGMFSVVLLCVVVICISVFIDRFTARFFPECLGLKRRKKVIKA